MPTCPRGHASVADDYCDDCGSPMTGADRAVHGTVPAPRTDGAIDTSRCPEPGCGTPRVGRFCEACGYDFEAPGPAEPDPGPRPDVWTAVVVADRNHYDRTVDRGVTDPESVRFPPYCPERHFTLDGERLLIGRRSRSRGITPDIDLAGPPEDLSVSHAHAYLVAQPAGTWTVVDPGSTNGTTLNEDPNRIATDVEVPLGDGDRIHLGAWTCITLRYGS